MIRLLAKEVRRIRVLTDLMKEQGIDIHFYYIMKAKYEIFRRMLALAIKEKME